MLIKNFIFILQNYCNIIYIYIAIKYAIWHILIVKRIKYISYIYVFWKTFFLQRIIIENFVIKYIVNMTYKLYACVTNCN